MTSMRLKRTVSVLTLALLFVPALLHAQKDREDEPTCFVNFVVLKDDNGKPVRNAAVIMHPVETNGKQGKGGMELKTDAEGKTNFDGIPYGKLRVQVLASGFQTYGEDFDIDKPKAEFTIKLKRPAGQYSIYDNSTKNTGSQTKPNAPAPDPNKKPN